MDFAARREGYHASPISRESAQERRRRECLEQQKQSRNEAFQLARARAGEALGEMEDLVLSGSESEEDQDVDMGRGGGNGAATPSKAAKKKQRRKQKRHKPWAANLLLHAEMLDLSAGLPTPLSDWSAAIIPAGKRCLAVASPSGTVLLSRAKGRSLATFETPLPPQTMIDGVWDQDSQILWCLDVVRWRGQWLVDSTREFRHFFLSSRLSELSPPAFPPPPRTLLLLPAPAFPQLTPASLPALLDAGENPAAVSFTGLVQNDMFGTQVLPIQLEATPTGFILYLQEAAYASGLTPLAGWVPNAMGAGDGGENQVRKFAELVAATQGEMDTSSEEKEEQAQVKEQEMQL